MPQTQEIPQVYPEHLPLVSLFQGYNPQTMAQVEGPYSGGWVPMGQDPITYAAGGLGGAARLAPGMFARAAMNVAPYVAQQAGRWQKIPNTTEPDIEGRNQTRYGGPKETEYQSEGTQKDFQSRYGARNYQAPTQWDWMGRPMRGGRGVSSSPRRTDAIVDPRFRKTERLSKAQQQELMKARPYVPFGERRDYPNPTGPMTMSYDELHKLADEFQRQRVADAIRLQQQGPMRIPIQITPTTLDQAFRLHGTPAMPTQIIGRPTVTSGGQFQYGAPATTELPNLFSGME